MKGGHIIIRGPAGAGKSTLARNLVAHFKKLKMRCVHQLPGRLRRKFKMGFSLKEKLKADNLLISRIKKDVEKGVIVILDEVFYYPGQILNFNKKLGRPIAIIHIKAALGTCLQRNRKRKGIRQLAENAVREVHALDSKYRKGIIIYSDRLTPRQVVAKAIAVISPRLPYPKK